MQKCKSAIIFKQNNIIGARGVFRVLAKMSLSFFLLLLLTKPAFAALEIELTKGIDSAIPIAVVPFDWTTYDGEPMDNISDIISNDLALSGRFQLLAKEAMKSYPHLVKDIHFPDWRNKNIENMVIGQVSSVGGGKYKVSFSLIDLYEKMAGETAKSPIIATQEYIVPAKDLRRLAHHISNIIYEKLTGDRGVFLTKIAYVLVQHQYGANPYYMLEVADMDGHHSKAIVQSSEPIMSPSWSPDGKKIAYVSFEGKRPRIFVSDLRTGKRELISSFPGINGAPAWSPDGTKLALALSLNRTNPNIYVLDLPSKRLVQMTNDLAINTEPRWSPDGRGLVFTSDRGGSPQIYSLSIDNHHVDRMSYDGNYNASPSYSGDGKSVVLLHRANRGFNIATLDVMSGRMLELTQDGSAESPSFAPNGKVIVYATQYRGKGVLGMISVDGRVKLRMPAPNGNVQEPVWSPFLD